MRKIIALVIVLLISFSVQSQRPDRTEVIVTGKVLDQETKQPLEYATISLISKRENKIVTGGITDNKGDFSIPILQGMYSVKIEYMSFKTQTLDNKKFIKDENLGTILLEIDIEALGEVEVIAERTTVEIKLDKKIYNVGKDLTVRGGTVSDVLDNVPSVSVDVEGNVALRGNDNVRILINGKPSGLVGLNSTDALRQLPAESIEKVEVITSPSARYDAEGTAGILNIILRRSKLQGLNGAITTTIGNPTSAGISGNINYRTGDFNFFNTSGYSYRESPGESSTKTHYYNEFFDDDLNMFIDNPDTFLNEEREFDRERKGLNTNFGVEWYVNKTASITTSILYRDSDNNRNTSNHSTEVDEFGNFIRETFRFDPEEEKDKTIQYSFNYDKQFNGDSQHKLTFDFQFDNSKEDEFSLITQDGIDTETVVTLEEQDRVLLKTDYVKPIGKDGQFEFGYRGIFKDMDTDYALSIFDENLGEFLLDTGVSNNLIYKEDVNAVYSQYGNKIKSKFSYLLGLRLENTRITINQITSNDLKKKNYTGLFPTVNLGYKISDDQSLTFGYSRRIRRPRSRFINPFPSRSSVTNVFQGNPDIDPSYSNTVDLGYLNKIGKLTLNSSIYYSHATDVFNFISEPTGDYYIQDINQTINENDPNFNDYLEDYESVIPVIRRLPINLATNDRFGFEFTASYRPSRKWNINTNFNLFQSELKGSYNGVVYDNENVSWFARLSNKYTLPGKVDWQTQIFYRGPSEDAQNKREGMLFTSMAFSKDLFNEKASLTLNVRDLFNTAKRTMESFTDSYYSNSEFQWRKRSVNLSFTYRFNQKKKLNGRNGGDNGGDDEMEF